MFNGVVVMGVTLWPFMLKRVQGLVSVPRLVVRRTNGTSAWTVSHRLKESAHMAVRSSIAAQKYDYFLVLDFEATCDNQQQLVPQVTSSACLANFVV